MNHSVEVLVNARYIEEQSRPENNQYVFAYSIQITNKGDTNVQLISRHWLITDAMDRVQEVKGIGVVGEQPVIPPDEFYTYTSGAVIETESGTMTGTYSMQDEEGNTFDAQIPTFALVRPQSLH